MHHNSSNSKSSLRHLNSCCYRTRPPYSHSTCSANVARHSRDSRTTLARHSRPECQIFILSPISQNTPRVRKHVARHSRDSRSTLVPVSRPESLGLFLVPVLSVFFFFFFFSKTDRGIFRLWSRVFFYFDWQWFFHI